MTLPTPTEIMAAIVAREELPPERGERGHEGKAGEIGPQGFEGPRGPKGNDGATGNPGAMGPKGDPGPVGPKGDKGDKGEKGDKGDDGERGPQGIPGPRGRAIGGFFGGGGGSSSGGGAVASVNGETGVVVLEAAEVPFTPAGSIAATNVQAAIEEVAAEAGGSGLPIAVPGIATVDTTTYDNPSGEAGKISTLVLSQYDTGFALALDGEAYPRVVMMPDGLFFGDGTFDPINDSGGSGIYPNGITVHEFIRGPVPNTQIQLEPDGTIFFATTGAIGASLNMGDVNQLDRGANLIRVDGPFQVSGNNGPAFMGGIGAPAIGGEVGDWYIRTDGANDSERLYRCTVAGGLGAATWVAVALGGGSITAATDPGDIADPTLATPESNALKINALFANLRTAGMLA